VGLAVAALAVRMFASLRVHNHEYRPFLEAQGLFLLCFLGLGISMFPYVIPTEIMIWEAAAPDNSLSFMLVGAIALVPLILGYTADAYYVFRGKIDPDAGYHRRAATAAIPPTSGWAAPIRRRCARRARSGSGATARLGRGDRHSGLAPAPLDRLRRDAGRGAMCQDRIRDTPFTWRASISAC
jgi:hypothetical protein